MSLDAFIAPRALAPLVLQYISMRYLDYSWPVWLAFIIYTVSLAIFGDMLFSHVNTLVRRHGSFDSHVARQMIPDARFTNSMVCCLYLLTLALTLILRPGSWH